MADERDSGENQSASRIDTGRLLFVAVLVLAVACTAVLVVTSSAQWLRLGVLGGLWAAILGVFLATRYRKQVVDREAEAAQLELEREVAARREYELEIEAETRRRIQEESRDDLSALRAELLTLRETLERLTGGEVLVERFALSAQGTRMRQLGGDRPPPMVAAGETGRARQVLAGDTINAGAELLEPAIRLPPAPVGEPTPQSPAAQGNGIVAALSGEATPTELVRPVGPGTASGYRAPVGMGSGHREPVSAQRQPGTSSGYHTAQPDEPGRRRVAVPRPELGRPAPARLDPQHPGAPGLETQQTSPRLPSPQRSVAGRQRPEFLRVDAQPPDAQPPDARPETSDTQWPDRPTEARPGARRAPEPRRRAALEFAEPEPQSGDWRPADSADVASRNAAARNPGSQRLDLRPRPADAQPDVRPQPQQSPLRPVSAPTRAEARPTAPRPDPPRAVPADPDTPRPAGGRRRAEDRATRQPERTTPQPEETGAHTEGRSVTELLAAHGVEDTGVGRRRRRAAD
jgi:uncharacterized protein DUF6779